MLLFNRGSGCRLLAVLPVALLACAGGRAHAGNIRAESATVDQGHAIASIDSLRASRHYPEALQLIEAALQRDPGSDGLCRRRVLTLEDMGSTERAWELMQQRPQLFSRDERERIENDRIASRIRWGEAYSARESQRHDESTDALRQLRTLQTSDPRTVTWQATRLRVDALSALNHLQRHREVVDGYQALLGDHVDVPVYILPTVADSMMALRRPEDASRLLQGYLKSQPTDANAQILLAYAWIEQERFDLALPLLERLAASQKPWPYRAGAKAAYQNWDKYTADSTLAMAHAYANDNASAERALLALARIGPANAALQSSLGSVASRQLQASAALQRYAMALTLDPREHDAELGEVDALATLHRVDKADAVMADLQTRYPEDPRVAREQHTLDLQRGWQLNLEAGLGHSSGGGDSASPLGSRDGEVNFEADSPLIGDRWRVALLARDDWAYFDGEDVRYRGAGLGLRYSYDRLSLSLDALQSDDDFGRHTSTFALGADWRFSDAWHGTLALDKNDPEASLQARRFGITADSVTLGTRYTPSDLTEIDTQWKHLHYDDGNRRDQLGVDAVQQIYSQPHLLVDWLTSASASHGSQGDSVPYFNPRRDASADVGLRFDHIDWRDYEQSYHELLDVTVGPYWEYRYGTAWVPTVTYRHRWQPQEGNQFEYGLSWSRPVYDGRRENRVAFNVTWRWGATP
jgi:biofilm PGA synthesis protein PgaA